MVKTVLGEQMYLYNLQLTFHLDRGVTQKAKDFGNIDAELLPSKHEELRCISRSFPNNPQTLALNL